MKKRHQRLYKNLIILTLAALWSFTPALGCACNLSSPKPRQAAHRCCPKENPSGKPQHHGTVCCALKTSWVERQNPVSSFPHWTLWGTLPGPKTSSPKGLPEVFALNNAPDLTRAGASPPLFISHHSFLL